MLSCNPLTVLSMLFLASTFGLLATGLVVVGSSGVVGSNGVVGSSGVVGCGAGWATKQQLSEAQSLSHHTHGSWYCFWQR